MSRLSEKPAESPLAGEGARDAAALSAEFSLEQRRILLRVAHDAILSFLERRPFPVAPPFPPGLSEPRGVFTTLYLSTDRTIFPATSRSSFTASFIVNYGDASAIRCPSRRCIAPWPKPRALRPSEIRVSCR
jgi:hypothetical protein